MTAWYLLHCKAKQEHRAALHLQNQGYDSYLPQWQQEKLVKGSKTLVTESLFPNYLFVNLDAGQANFNAIRSTRGVNGFVRFGGVPATVPAQLMASIQQQAQRPQASKPLFAPESTVEVTAGPFAGLQAIYKASKGSDRALILLSLLGQEQELEVTLKELKAV
ncbi:transcription/translation regulatory transformer protein RfaH [Alkalimonas sp. NCh-2]|uniref:transcription/translation regulatory transformer protein RfaH n=1 Tax=Alkalimonas sp. NCh-2 TaxID=3144846 RepID=UPI0031F7079A